MELITAYNYTMPGPFQAAINRQLAKENHPSIFGYWVTADGQMIKPLQMTNSHLLACIRISEERTKGMPMRQIAQRFLDKQGMQVYDRLPHIREFKKELIKTKTYINMIREAKKRGLIQ